MLVTTFIAGMFGAYANDLIFFRQALFLACTTLFSTLGCLRFSKKRRPTVRGALGGAIGGLLFVAITLLSPLPFYLPETQYLLSQLPRISVTFTASIELSLAPFAAMILGSASGPLFYFYLKGNTSPGHRRHQTLSWCFLGAACLLMLFSMMDRLDFGSGLRNWMYAVPLLLVAFVVHTVIWVQEEQSM